MSIQAFISEHALWVGAIVVVHVLAIGGLAAYGLWQVSGSMAHGGIHQIDRRSISRLLHQNRPKRRHAAAINDLTYVTPMQLCVDVLVMICPLHAATHNPAERWALDWTAPARAWQDHLFAERRNAATQGRRCHCARAWQQRPQDQEGREGG